MLPRRSGRQHWRAHIPQGYSRQGNDPFGRTSQADGGPFVGWPGCVEAQGPDHPSYSLLAFSSQRLTNQCRRHNQLDSLGLLPTSIRRLLIDESIPGASLTLVPDLSPGDFLKLLETPTKESVEYWILHGERSVWPAVSALKVRCAIEVELDRSYQFVRRRKPFDTGSPIRVRTPSSGDFRNRRRAASAGQT